MQNQVKPFEIISNVVQIILLNSYWLMCTYTCSDTDMNEISVYFCYRMSSCYEKNEHLAQFSQKLIEGNTNTHTSANLLKHSLNS